MTKAAATRTSGPKAKVRLIPHDEVFAEWRKEPAYRAAYDALEDEFSIMSALIKARAQAGLTQAQVAERMKSTQPAVARLEASGRIPSTTTLKRYAEATGHRLRITLEPLDKPQRASKQPGHK